MQAGEDVAEKFCQAIFDKFDDVALKEIFGKVFTVEYVDKNFNSRVPEKYREQFVKIIREFK